MLGGGKAACSRAQHRAGFVWQAVCRTVGKTCMGILESQLHASDVVAEVREIFCGQEKAMIDKAEQQILLYWPGTRPWLCKTHIETLCTGWDSRLRKGAGNDPVLGRGLRRNNKHAWPAA